MKKVAYKHSPEAIAKIIASNRRRVVSLETRKKMSDAMTIDRVEMICVACGKKKMMLPCQARDQKYCSPSCMFRSSVYRNKHKKKVSHFKSGREHWNWQGGITSENKRVRASTAMKEWRKKILERDAYKCVVCGSTDDLEVDHIKPFALFAEERLNLNNGRTVCNPCHTLTETYAGRVVTLRKLMTLT